MNSNKVVVLLNTPSSALRASSPSRGEVNNVRGFTLIELLVVVLIIGILAAGAVPQYKKAVAKARTAEALAMLKTLVQAEEVYYLANGTGTTEISKLDVDIPATQIAEAHAKADVNQPNTYMYWCTAVGDCIANACNPDMPLLQYTSRTKKVAEGGYDDKGFFWCVPHTWTSGCDAKNEIAEGICKSMNNGRETMDYKNGVTTYYRIN